MRIFYSLILTLSLSATTAYTYAQDYKYEYNKNIYQNLHSIQHDESSTHTREEIDALNQQTIDDLYKYRVTREVTLFSGKRYDSVNQHYASSLIRAINLNPVVSSYSYSKYDPENRGIGFCFGRALFTHISLLQSQINKDAIKKAWIIGPMKNGNYNWAWHVTTIVLDEKGKWVAIDNVPGGQVLEISDWLKYFKPWNTDGKLRLFISNPQKFTPNPGKYSRNRLQLDTSPETDWYNNYFKDQMDWFRDNDVRTAYNLPELEHIQSN